MPFLESIRGSTLHSAMLRESVFFREWSYTRKARFQYYLDGANISISQWRSGSCTNFGRQMDIEEPIYSTFHEAIVCTVGHQFFRSRTSQRTVSGRSLHTASSCSGSSALGCFSIRHVALRTTPPLHVDTFFLWQHQCGKEPSHCFSPDEMVGFPLRPFAESACYSKALGNSLLYIRK